MIPVQDTTGIPHKSKHTIEVTGMKHKWKDFHDEFRPEIYFFKDIITDLIPKVMMTQDQLVLKRYNKFDDFNVKNPKLIDNLHTTKAEKRLSEVMREID